MRTSCPRSEKTVLHDSPGCDLDVWTFEQLRKIVGDFKKSKQAESPVFDLTGAGANGLHDFDQLQSPTDGPEESRSFAATDPNATHTAKFIETKHQVLSNKNLQMKHDLDDIFADLDALKVKKVNDLFNLNGKPQSQAKPLPAHFSDFEINDKGEIVLLNSVSGPEPATSLAEARTESRGDSRPGAADKRQPGEGPRRPERRKREEASAPERVAETEEPAGEEPVPSVEVVK